MMCEQYMSRDNGEIDHQFMSAGEYAVDVLEAHGLLNPSRRGGFLNEKGRALLERTPIP